VLPGVSSAIVYVPDTPRAEKLPIVSFGHGSRGQAGKCAPSRFTPDGERVRKDFENAVFPLVGAGYVVIAPDWAGYANYGAEGNPPSGYAVAEDVAKSMLDSTRALRKMAPALLSDDIVFVGHSQGGHTVLSTLAFSESYGAAGKVKGVVTYAPLWLPQRSWGAVLALPDTFNFKDSRVPNAVGIWYHYTKGELFDGPGGGLAMFQESKRAAVKKFVDETCWGDFPLLESLGTKPTDVYDPAFAEAIGLTAAGLGTCSTAEPAKSTCEKWMARYKEDRPVLTGEAAKVPILFVYGNKDTTLAPDRMTCARDWLASTGGNVAYCVEPEATHGGIVSERAGYANEWIAGLTLGAGAPAPCPKGGDDIVDATGAKATCNTLPPNE
jgi:pimeloyl-ACP methyl ester carboxylesterase